MNILIAENAPSFNKGEMAIIYGIRECIKDINNAKLSMLSFRADYDRERYGKILEIIDTKKSWPIIKTSNDGQSLLKSAIIAFYHFTFVLLFKLFGKGVLRFLFTSPIWREYVITDLVIIGHDSSFGIGGDPETPLFYPLYIPIIAKLLKKRVIFFAGTIPNFPRRFKKLFRILVKCALKHTDTITLREHKSLRKLEEIDFKHNDISVTSDPAFLLTPAADDIIASVIKNEGLDNYKKPWIGLTISRARGILAYPDLNNPDLAYEKHLEIIAYIVDAVIENIGAHIIFIPHCVGFNDESDDRDTARKIYEKCKNKEKICIVCNEYGPDILKGLIGQMDLLIGERLHSVIAAITMGVPAIAISYKADQRLGMIEMVDKDAICYVENLDTNKLLAKIDYLWTNRYIIADKSKLSISKVKKATFQNKIKLEGFLN